MSSLISILINTTIKVLILIILEVLYEIYKDIKYGKANKSLNPYYTGSTL